jgi:hypothetical protein
MQTGSQGGLLQNTAKQTPMPTTKSRRRWIQFNLRTLLGLVTAFAVLFWGYWVLLPLWNEYRERRAFEQAVVKLKAGATLSDLWKLTSSSPPGEVTVRVGTNATGDATALMSYQFGSNRYCFFLIQPPNPSISQDYVLSREVRVYRMGRSLRLKTPDAPPDDYARFFGLLNGRVSGEMQIEYELIHTAR